jgi:hypothetical protein
LLQVLFYIEQDSVTQLSARQKVLSLNKALVMIERGGGALRLSCESMGNWCFHKIRPLSMAWPERLNPYSEGQI